MRTSDVDILMVPGWSDSGPDHWQSRWERGLPTARRIEQEDWREPSRDKWVGRIIAAIGESVRRPVLVGHSLGCVAIAHAAAKLPRGSVAGAFLVAPADAEQASQWPLTEGQRIDAAATGFAPMPREAFAMPARLIASSDDPYCKLGRAQAFAAAWGAAFVDAGPCGHINAAAGFGPWPDGVLRFGGFLKSLG